VNGAAYRRFVLDTIAPPPPSWPGERWFQQDLPEMGTDDLIDERRRCQLRVLLTPPHARNQWPALWIAQRVERIGAELRERGVRP